MTENTDQKNSKYGHFLRSASYTHACHDDDFNEEITKINYGENQRYEGSANAKINKEL